jgi:hypothetical protein
LFHRYFFSQTKVVVSTYVGALELKFESTKNNFFFLRS